MKRLHGGARLLRFKLSQRIRGIEAPVEPHFDPASTARFYDEIGKAASYLEFGSGGSTMAAARLRIPTVSVESDRFYARVVRRSLPPGHQVTLLPVNIGITREWGRPAFRARNVRGYRRWLRYVDAPFEHVRQFPSFVLVDGRFRPACALETARQAHTRGARAVIMYDDYVDRPKYHIVERYLGAPEIVGRAAFFRVGTEAVPRDAILELARDPY